MSRDHNNETIPPTKCPLSHRYNIVVHLSHPLTFPSPSPTLSYHSNTNKLNSGLQVRRYFHNVEENEAQDLATRKPEASRY